MLNYSLLNERNNNTEFLEIIPKYCRCFLKECLTHKNLHEKKLCCIPFSYNN